MAESRTAVSLPLPQAVSEGRGFFFAASRGSAIKVCGVSEGSGHPWPAGQCHARPEARLRFCGSGSVKSSREQEVSKAGLFDSSETAEII